MARDDGHGPVFSENDVRLAIAESASVAADSSRTTDQRAQYRRKTVQDYWQRPHDSSQAENSMHQNATADMGQADRFVPPTINIEPAPLSPPVISPPSEDTNVNKARNVANAFGAFADGSSLYPTYFSTNSAFRQ